MAPHYFRGDFFFPPLLFFFFCVQRSWALLCDWSSNRPGNANNPSSEDVQWRDCWDGTRRPAQLATLKAEPEREMSGDWVKLSERRGLQSLLGWPCHIGSDEMCLLLIAFTRGSCFCSQLVPLFFNHRNVGTEWKQSFHCCGANYTLITLEGGSLRMYCLRLFDASCFHLISAPFTRLLKGTLQTLTMTEKLCSPQGLVVIHAAFSWHVGSASRSFFRNNVLVHNMFVLCKIKGAVC